MRKWFATGAGKDGLFNTKWVRITPRDTPMSAGVKYVKVQKDVSAVKTVEEHRKSDEKAAAKARRREGAPERKV